jgi:hypothetical protein
MSDSKLVVRAQRAAGATDTETRLHRAAEQGRTLDDIIDRLEFELDRSPLHNCSHNRENRLMLYKEIREGLDSSLSALSAEPGNAALAEALDAASLRAERAIEAYLEASRRSAAPFSASSDAAAMELRR